MQDCALFCNFEYETDPKVAAAFGHTINNVCLQCIAHSMGEELCNQCFSIQSERLMITNSLCKQCVRVPADEQPADLPFIRRECASCGLKSEEKGALKRCAGCSHIYYCGEACQKKHWSSHKKECTKIKAMREHRESLHCATCGKDKWRVEFDESELAKDDQRQCDSCVDLRAEIDAAAKYLKKNPRLKPQYAVGDKLWCIDNSGRTKTPDDAKCRIVGMDDMEEFGVVLPAYRVEFLDSNERPEWIPMDDVHDPSSWKSFE